LIVIPYLDFTEAELDKLKDYVLKGGTLLILDDYGYGNKILEYFGLSQRFSGAPLLDPLFNYKNKQFPKVMDFTPEIEGVEGILLNHASSLSGVSEEEVLAWSSQFSFLDLDNNSAWDEGEPMGPLPVAAHIKLSEGNIVLVADPSILINSMDMEDNYRFIKKLIEIENPNPVVFIDQSHLPGAALDEAKGVLATVQANLRTPLGTIGLIAVILILILRPVWRRRM